MYSLAAYNAGDKLLAHLYRSAEITRSSIPADRGELQVPVLRYISYYEADLVHMRVEHNFIFRLGLSLYNHETAERIYAIFASGRQMRNYIISTACSCRKCRLNYKAR